MYKSTGYLVLFFLFNLLPFNSFSQGDTTFVRSSIADALKSYKTSIGIHAHLYNGTEYYVPVKSYVEGHQFFLDKVFQKGDIKADGAWFEEVPMLYDLVYDELLITNHSGGQQQRLVKKHIDAFKLGGHTFVRLQPDSTTDLTIKPGFYDLLHQGQIQLLVKREKVLFERTSTSGLEGEFRDKSKYYLVKDNIFYPVSNKRSVLRVLEDQRKPLSRFASANKLRFKKEREAAILKTVEHYESLEPES